MPSFLQRWVHLFDVRLLVWVPGIWLIFSHQPPLLLTHLDQQLFFAGLALSPKPAPTAPIDVIELSSQTMQQFLDDPVSADEVMQLMDHVNHNEQIVALLLPTLPRQNASSAEQLLHAVEKNSAIYPQWYAQQIRQAQFQQWLNSGAVIIGSDAIPVQVKKENAIRFTPAPWEKFYAWLPSSFDARYAQPDEALIPVQLNQGLRILPLELHSPGLHPLNTPLVWFDGDEFYASIALALLQRLQQADKIHWRDALHFKDPSPFWPVNRDGSVTPIYRADTRYPPTIARYTIEEFIQQDHPAAAVLVGATGDPRVIELAANLQSLHSRQYYISPWWFYGVEKILMLGLLLYALYGLPRMGLGVACLSTTLLLVLLLIAQWGSQLIQQIFLPLGISMQYLVGAFVVMTLWRQQRKGQQVLVQRHQEIATELSRHLFQQGQLERAAFALATCQTSDQVLQLLYDIGGLHERKRRPAEALRVYHLLVQRRGHFKDTRQRILQLENKPFPAGRQDDPALTRTIALGDAHSRPQFGRYNIERELGRGAMGVVYLAHDPHIGRKVAIKTLNYEHVDPAELAVVKARFFREAEAAGRLQHPNIVTVYDVGEEHDLAFIAMDYIAGQPLSQFIRPQNVLSPQRVYRIVADVATALSYAHSKQVIHRDIKPGNILYHRDSGKVTVTDFGIARIGSQTRTQTGEIVGSPTYMSPEQVRGQKVGAASDIFSLGVTFFQLLSGKLPFASDTMAGLSYQIIHGPHKNIRDLSSHLPASAARIINKALQKEAKNRFVDAQDMARALNNALQKDF